MPERVRTLLHRLWSHPAHLLWAAAAYVPWLGSLSVPLTGDQKLYLSVSMEMRERGQWLIPVFLGQSDFTKPPWEYWVTLLGWKVFGFGLWGALIPSVFAALATAWLIGEIALLIGERRVFVGSGLWFMAALGTATYGWVAQMEIWVCFFHAAAWWAGLRYLSRPHPNRDPRWMLLAFAIAGLSALVKSPLYSVFWVTGYLAYLLTSGEWELFRARHLYGSLCAGILLGVSWYVYAGVVDGARFWEQYVLQETLGKRGGNGGSIASIWIAFLYLCFPFTVFLPAAIRVLWRWRRTSDVVRLALCWTLPAAIFFSLHPYRVKTYLYLLVPMAALLIDWGYARLGRGRWYRFAIVATGVASVTLLCFVGVVLFRAEIAPFWVSCGFVVTGIAMLLLSILGSFRGLVIAGLAAVLLFRAACVAIGEEDLSGLRAWVAEHPAVTLMMVDETRSVWHDAGMLSVALERKILRVDDMNEAVSSLRNGTHLVLSDTQALGLDGIRAKLLGLGEMRNIETRTWPRWKTVRKFPLGRLIREGRGAVDFDEATRRDFIIVWLSAP